MKGGQTWLGKWVPLAPSTQPRSAERAAQG